MFAAIIVGLLTFTVTAGFLRIAERLYHRARHTADWSPHWGTWAFAALAGAFAFVEFLGR